MTAKQNEDQRCGKVAKLVRDGVAFSAALRQCDVKAAAFQRWQKNTAGSSLQNLWDMHSVNLGTADAVHATLREAIISGVLKPGDKLGEEYLASEFHVSRTPVREALTRLCAERLAVRMARRGLIVRSVSEREVLDFYAVRVALDGLAAKLAAKPEAIRALTLYRAKIQSLLELGFGFEPCQLGDLTDRVFGLQQQYGLLTNDAMVLAVALRLKANALVSSDKAFRDIKEPDLYTPTDLRL